MLRLLFFEPPARNPKTQARGEVISFKFSVLSTGRKDNTSSGSGQTPARRTRKFAEGEGPKTQAHTPCLGHPAKLSEDR